MKFRVLRFRFRSCKCCFLPPSNPFASINPIPAAFSSAFTSARNALVFASGCVESTCASRKPPSRHSCPLCAALAVARTQQRFAHRRSPGFDPARLRNLLQIRLLEGAGLVLLMMACLPLAPLWDGSARAAYRAGSSSPDLPSWRTKITALPALPRRGDHRANVGEQRLPNFIQRTVRTSNMPRCRSITTKPRSCHCILPSTLLIPRSPASPPQPSPPRRQPRASADCGDGEVRR